MNDITILYQGGSGGFALYYYLLLTGRYQYTTDTVQHMIAQQFPQELSTAPKTWKQYESWPNNVELKTKSGHKIFLICNPLFNPDMLETNCYISDNTYKILLCADVHLQLRMAYDKQAYWFTDVSREQFSAPDCDKKYMRQILDSAVDSLDPQIQQIQQVFEPDQVLDLVQFVNLDATPQHLSPTQSQMDFLKRWRLLQTAKAQRLLS